MALSGTAFAGDFWSSTLSIQGKTLDLGEAGRTTNYAAFTTNGTFSASTTVNGEVDVDGNVGVNGTSLTLSNSVIHGDATLKTGGTFNVPNASQITGARNQSTAFNTKLSNGATAATTFATTAASLTATSNYTSSMSLSGGNLILNSQSILITDNTANDTVVLKLGTFALNNSTFTLDGTATTKFIIDVTGSFNVANASSILLAGGLTAGNVIFNYTGTSNTAGISGSTLNGILLAANAPVSMTGNSVVNGEVIGKSISMSGGSKIKKPAPASP